MSRFHEVRHYLIGDYGFSVGLDLTDPGALHFECFMVVAIYVDGPRPIYL